MNILLVILLAAPIAALADEQEDLDYVKQKLAAYNARINGRIQKELEASCHTMNEPEHVVPISTNNQRNREEHVKTISEINMNSSMANAYFEGDIQLTREQADIMLSDSKDRTKRQAASLNIISLWDRNISWRFDKDFIDDYKKFVRYAVALYGNLTCLKFTERESAQKILEFHSRGGCSSAIGMHKSNEFVQAISLGGGCSSIGVAAHEIGHALGLFHTQSRHDRDNYVEVIDENIEFGWHSQFVKRTPYDNNNLGIPYDLGSVMHYDQHAFWKNGKESIKSHDKFYQLTMGSDLDSFYDIKLINTLYGCTDECANFSTNCTNGGYPNPNNCSTCLCPSGFGGRLCNKLPDGGSEILLTPGKQTCLADRKNPESRAHQWVYTTYGFRTFWIKAPENMKIKITYKYSPGTCGSGCTNGGVEIKAQTDWAATGYRFCCKNDTVVLSSGPMVPIIVYNRVDFSQEFSFCAEAVYEDITTTLPTTTTSSIKTTTEYLGENSCVDQQGNGRRNGESWEELSSILSKFGRNDTHGWECINRTANLIYCTVSSYRRVAVNDLSVGYKLQGKVYKCMRDGWTDTTTTTSTQPPTTTTTTQPTTTTTTTQPTTTTTTTQPTTTTTNQPTTTTTTTQPTTTTTNQPTNITTTTTQPTTTTTTDPDACFCEDDKGNARKDGEEWEVDGFLKVRYSTEFSTKLRWKCVAGEPSLIHCVMPLSTKKCLADGSDTICRINSADGAYLCTGNGWTFIKSTTLSPPKQSLRHYPIHQLRHRPLRLSPLEPCLLRLSPPLLLQQTQMPVFVRMRKEMLEKTDPFTGFKCLAGVYEGSCRHRVGDVTYMCMGDGWTEAPPTMTLPSSTSATTATTTTSTTMQPITTTTSVQLTTTTTQPTTTEPCTTIYPDENSCLDAQGNVRSNGEQWEIQETKVTWECKYGKAKVLFCRNLRFGATATLPYMGRFRIYEKEQRCEESGMVFVEPIWGSK